MSNRKINFKTVITKEDIRTLTEEELAIIEKDARIQGKIFRGKYSDTALLEKLHSAREQANKAKYSNLSSTAKEVFAATVALPSYTTVVKILIEYGINYMQLYTISRSVSSIKKAIIEHPQLINDITIKRAILKLNSVCEIFYTELGIRDYNLIIAKLNDILIHKKDLFTTLENKKPTL